MSCQELLDELLGYVDGRLPEAERAAVASHLAQCAACAHRLAEIRRVWELLDQLPELAPSPAFHARLRLRQQASWSFGDWLRQWLRPAAAVAAAAALACWISLRLPPRPSAALPVSPGEPSSQDFLVVKDLPVLENYDVLVNFDALTALPGAQSAAQEPVE